MEVVKTYHVPVPDPNPRNNTASGTVTVASETNVNPMFVVVRSVEENSQGVNLGDPVPVLPGDDDTLRYTGWRAWARTSSMQRASPAACSFP